MKVRRLLSILAVVLFAAMLRASNVEGQGLGIEATPAKFDGTLEAGKIANVPITVHNYGIGTAHIQASMVDFQLSPTGEYRFTKVGTLPDSLMKYASIRPREFDLPPGQPEQVQLSLQFPENAHLAGEYAGIVFFQTRPERGAGTNVALSVRVASKFYISIPNTLKVAGAITKMTAVQGPFNQTYRVVFDNTGNGHTYLDGTLTIQRGSEVVERIPMQNSILVERGQSRVIEVSGKKLPSGTYQALAMIDYGGKNDTGGVINFTVH